MIVYNTIEVTLGYTHTTKIEETFAIINFGGYCENHLCTHFKPQLL
jgi:hypothetical protein